MNLDSLQHELAEIVNSGDPTFASFAQQINEIVEQAKAGQMSGAETKEILADAQLQLGILEDMSQLALKEKLNTVITGLITLAALV
jgi:Asp-tRNA(Asn)/Glu-tRNA(Gln) amidotransferase B subunit